MANVITADRSHVLIVTDYSQCTEVFAATRNNSKKPFSFQIRNYAGPCRIMVSLVTDEQVPRPHAHELVGKNCKNGICVVEMKGNSEMVAT